MPRKGASEERILAGLQQEAVHRSLFERGGRFHGLGGPPMKRVPVRGTVPRAFA